MRIDPKEIITNDLLSKESIRQSLPSIFIDSMVLDAMLDVAHTQFHQHATSATALGLYCSIAGASSFTSLTAAPRTQAERGAT